MTHTNTYWDKFGSDWSLIGPPLRPCSEDNEIMERLIARWDQVARIPAPQAVLLGVTQEIVSMKWPEKTHLLAFDREPGMIRSLWPQHRLSNAAALCANWLSLPLVDGSADIVVGDGSLSLLAFPGEYRELARELARVLAPGGLVVLRLYVVPDVPDSMDEVFRELWAGMIGNFNTFKWRLAMAMLDPADYGVTVSDMWEVWQTRIDCAEGLSDALGWPLPVIRMIERYRGCTATRYSFPPLASVREAFEPFFTLDEVVFPSYQDGRRYPTVCFRTV